MKEIMTTGLVACALASTAFASEYENQPTAKIRVGVDVDYTWSAMAQVNKDLDKGVDVTNLNSGIAGMLDLNVVLAPFLVAGMRSGFLFCMPASATYNLGVQTTTIKASLIPLEGGLSAILVLPSTPVSITAGAYAGYGFAFADYKTDLALLGQTSTVTQPYHGGGFCGELLAAVNLKLLPAFSINGHGGLRLAKIPQMTQSQDVNYESVAGIDFAAGSKGDIRKDSDSKVLVFDFSGFSLGGGFIVGF